MPGRFQKEKNIFPCRDTKPVVARYKNHFKVSGVML
jgi:hypothetical protein